MPFGKTDTACAGDIPACGGFMLAERYLELFEEGKEAGFFSTKGKLLEKVRYYLNHSEKRKQIAQAGRERCLRSGYSNQERMKEMLEIIKREGNRRCKQRVRYVWLRR